MRGKGTTSGSRAPPEPSRGGGGGKEGSKKNFLEMLREGKLRKQNTTPDRNKKAEKAGKKGRKKEEDTTGIAEMRQLMEGWAARKHGKRSREEVGEEIDRVAKELRVEVDDDNGSTVKKLMKKFDKHDTLGSDNACSTSGRGTGAAGQGDAGGPLPELTSDGRKASSVDSDSGLNLKINYQINIVTCSAIGEGGIAGGQRQGHDGGGDGVTAMPQLEKTTRQRANRREGDFLSDSQPDNAAADGVKTGSGGKVYTTSA